MLKAPQNLFATAYDGSVRSEWQAVDGADGYILQFYNADEPEKCIKSRYAQHLSKQILGFRNGKKYLVRVRAFRYSGGREIAGELSQPAEFTPICQHLKAQNVIAMNKGETSQIVWERKNIVPAVVFSCDDESVATVTKGGQVTATSDGIARITLTADDKETFTVNVAVGRSLSRSSSDARLMLCGDIMCSLEQQRKAATRSLDFTDTFKALKSTIGSTDYSVAVLETTCFDGAPFEYEKIRTDSGSPNCNSPSTFVDAVKSCGFSALVTANNHNCDTGLKGLEATVRCIKNSGMANIGTLDDETHIADINGIRVGFVAVNSISNGLEKDIPPHLIGKYEPVHFRELVNSLKNDGAEYIIAYQHWGQMNSVTVRDAQRKAAEYMAQCGVNLIIGSHPHVMQRAEKMTTADGREVMCFYSLGNFISSMKEMRENRESAIVDLTLTRTDGSVTADITCIPVLCEDTSGGYKVTVLDGSLTESRRAAREHIKSILGNSADIGGKPKLLLQGSAVLRKVFSDSGYNYDDTPLILSPVSLMSEQSTLAGKCGNVRNKLDIAKNFNSYISNSKTDYIVIDLYTPAAVSCYKYGNSYYTASQNFLSSDFYNNNKDKFERISPPFDEKVWKKALKKYAKTISSYYAKDRIILVRLKFSDICVKQDQLRNGKNRNALNKRIRMYEDYLISLLQPVVIDVAGGYFADGTSGMVTAYEPLFYDDVRIKTDMVIRRETDGSICFDKPDINLWLCRVIRYYDNMTARAYQPKLLDRTYAADRLIELTSKRFTAENAAYLALLRENEVKSYDDAKIILGRMYGAEKVISVINAVTCINGDLSECRYEDIRIIFQENFIVKKQLAKKLTEVYKYANADNCERIFLIKDDINALCEYEKTCKPTVVDIWGSCISRETVNRNISGIFVDKYIFKQPFLLSEEPDIPFDINIGADKFCGSSWRKRTVKEAFLHEGRQILSDSTADWLIIDMYDLICNMKKYCGSLFEVDDFILRTDFYKTIADKCESTYLFKEKSREYLDKSLESFSVFVNERYGKNIILIKADLKSSYITLDNKISELSDSDNTFEKKKTFIAEYEDKFAQQTDCYVIDISKRYYADDRFPLGGAHIVHYEDEFYNQCCKHISEILSGSKKRYRNDVDEEYIALRDLRI